MGCVLCCAEIRGGPSRYQPQLRARNAIDILQNIQDNHAVPFCALNPDLLDVSNEPNEYLAISTHLRAYEVHKKLNEPSTSA
jgi:hypothetical protein